MKKISSLFVLICIVLTLVSCGLPDPTIAVDAYFKGISNGDSDFAKQIKEEIADEYLEEYPGAQRACDAYVAAYFNSFEYEIHKDRTQVDNQAKTALVYVTYSCVDLAALTTEVSASEEFFDYALEHYSDIETVMIYMLELVTEKINSGDWTPLVVDAVVELRYDAGLKAWIITNEDDVFGDLT